MGQPSAVRFGTMKLEKNGQGDTKGWNKIAQIAKNTKKLIIKKVIQAFMQSDSPMKYRSFRKEADHFSSEYKNVIIKFVKSRIL